MPRRSSPYLIRAEFKPDAQPTPDYPYNIPAIRNTTSIEFHPNVTFFVGENGSGKSTFLEAIAAGLGFGPEGGTRNTLFSTSDSGHELHKSLRLARGTKRPSDFYFLRAESFFNLATYMDGIGLLGAYGGTSLHESSHGEAFLRVLTHKLRGHGLYLMDEPEAALSPSRQMAALTCIHHLVNAHSQFIIATHSPILLAYPHAKVLQFDESGIHETAYEQTKAFFLTRDFLNHYPHRLKRLLDEENPEAD